MSMFNKLPEMLKAGRRTRRETRYSKDRWTMIHTWALDNGYHLEEGDSSTELRRYKKRFNWLLPATFMELTRKGERLTLDFWVNADAYLVVSLLTFRPSEVRLERGGLAGAIPRRLARNNVNELLGRLNLEKITSG